MVATFSLVLSILAFVLSAIAVYQTHFAPFMVSAVSGSIEHRIYPIRSGDERWYISSFHVPLTVINTGAVPGFVTGIRLRLHYPDVKIVGNYELAYASREVFADKITRISSSRFEWIDEACQRWTPFAVPTKTAVTIHNLIEVKWENPVIQDAIEATLEIQANWKDNWQEVGKYRFLLDAPIWMMLVSGSSFTYAAKKTHPGSLLPERHPPSLHTRTGPATPLPTGALDLADFSLDYPSGRPEEEE